MQFTLQANYDKSILKIEIRSRLLSELLIFSTNSLLFFIEFMFTMCYYVYTMEEKDIIANNIAFHRKKNGMSQLDLAEKLKYSNKNISKWENGETTPNVFVLKKLANIFNTTVDNLITNKAEPENYLDNQNKIALKRKFISQVCLLVLANVLLFAIACVSIYILVLLQVDTFNVWLILLYITPLCCLSVFIFIRCIFKRIDVYSLSLFGWLIATCIYVSFLNIKNIAFIYIVAAAYQLLVICLTILINLKLIDKFAINFKEFRQRFKNKHKNNK